MVQGRVPPSNYWMFQFNPKVYDWFGWIKENSAAKEQWLVSRYNKIDDKDAGCKIGKEDKVAVWAAGKESGIYALAQTTTYPLKNSLNPKQAQYYHSTDGVNKFLDKPSVNIKYLKIFADKPITRKTCETDTILCSLEILNNFTEATNFKLRKSQWDRISVIAP